MGTYFNPDNQGFRTDIQSRIYIDKTGLISYTNSVLCTSERCIALSHARRFGKSQAATMLKAYYSRGCDSEELFSGFEIAESPDFRKHLNQYNVIHFDVSSFSDDFGTGLIKEIKRHIYDEFREEYPEIDYSKSTAAVLMQVYKKSAVRTENEEKNIPFVIIIDEWDCVIRNYPDKPEFVHEYLQFLHSLFKSDESKTFLALGYITGIVPVKKIKDESALNNFDEYTMTDSGVLTEYFGFTEDEVKELCSKYDMNFDSVKAWYNGYLISGEHMYNPNSVYMAMVRHSLESYWKNTSAFETLNTFIALNLNGLREDVMKMLSGEKVYVDVKGFENDLSNINNKDDALTALIHLGYLGYDKNERSAYIPNYEVKEAYQSALSKGKCTDIAAAISQCDKLLWATIDKESKKVSELQMI